MTHENLPPEPIWKVNFRYKDFFPGLFPKVARLVLQLIQVDHPSGVTQIVGTNPA